MSTFKMSEVRTEHGCFMYRYEPCNVGNIRKMVIVLPMVNPINYREIAPKFEQEQHKPEAIY